MSSDYPAQYAEPGYLLFVRDGVLLAQPFDAGTGSLGGAPVTIAPRVAVSPNVNFRSAELSVSAAGALAYQTGWVRSRLTWLDRRGNVERVLGEPDDYVEADLSPDGTQIALEVNEENGFGEIWLMDAARGTRVPLTRTPDQWEYSPRWSPDGRYVAFSNLAAVHTQLADRSGAAELLGVTSPSPTLQFLRQWTGDGRILFTRLDGGLFSMPASPNGEPAPLPGSGASESQARVSPDGRWLAYTSTETGRREVYVRPVEGGPSRLISTAGGGHPLWHRDGRELYYLASDGTIVAAPVTRGSTLEVGMPKPLFKTRPSQDELRQAYSTVDGERFLVRTLDETTAPAIAWLVNWRALIER
jgi:dipeptidyl aminopeptidase/acylaminoacyl peptidase